MKIGLVALATLAFATSVSAVSAAENPFAQDKAVLNLKDLDLASADGQQRLAIRLDQAARAVCGDRLAGVHLALEAKSQECRTAVTADVRSQIEARMASGAAMSSVRLAALR
ncbi:UrcA family protein [Novosphingobium sp. MMS21-SN21R]|uniref:UrcA family protein n=1 Tax=Novosphingobium sp. MMS21-SN21R TaxID=2969298 RepID=UPI002886C0A4|nr:UrcA family protein [Novosphingobium sp. MMS21-SN21R]MDT0508496.1 UrcA family protein [Novosphingobium sp. MMS21-SN21R]